MFKRGRGGGKRALPPPLPTRPASVPGASRAPLGSARSRPGSAPGDVGGPQGKEESFSLSSSLGVDFGAIIRLTPDLIEEIRRVELQGGSAKIKFATNSNFPSGNVIEVSGKEFGFTWSRDDLCDIYEERQSGEDGGGLLVERGSAWRKLNVHRTLDESTKKHVKERSEEAERLSKSRKSIVLDPANPAMKSQVKQMAAAGVDGNMRTIGWKQKNEPVSRKQKAEPNKGPQKSFRKSGSSSDKLAKDMLSVSHILPSHEHPLARASLSPFATGISSRGDAELKKIVAPSDINKEHIDIGSCEKEMPCKTLCGTKSKLTEQKGNTCDQPTDTQDTRAEKASQNRMNLETEAPGKFMKSGKEVERSKQQGPESGRSLQSTNDISPARVSTFGERVTDVNFPQQAHLSLRLEEDLVEKIDIMDEDPDPSNNGNDKASSNNNEGKTSSSESDSDSESESSDYGSQGRSRSKSRNLAGRASSSTSDSDSDSDSSSSSKERSDVDIMTNKDEKEVDESKTMATDFNLSVDCGEYWNKNGPESKIRKSDGSKSSRKASVCRRELPDLEVSELHEAPSGGEVVGVKISFQGGKCCKSPESGFVDSSNLDMNNLGREVSGDQHRSIVAAKLLQRSVPSYSQLKSKVDHADSQVKYSLDCPTEIAHRGDPGTSSGIDLENHAAPLRKTPATCISPHHPINSVVQVGERNSTKLREHKRNILGDSTNWRNNSASMGNDTSSRKRKESPSADDSAFYSKYDKEVSHVKDSIKDLSQYQDYVQEFHEKYDLYVSLNKNLENIRTDFLKIGKQLERAKEESEEYYMALNQLKELYRQHGERNKKMKKTFIVLHDELKTLKQRIKEFVEMHNKK